MTGELGIVRRYAYWSERRIRSIASENGIAIDRRFSWKAKSANIPVIGSLEFAQNAQALDRATVADRIERAIGRRAVDDFVTPPRVQFAKGCGHVEFAEFAGVRENAEGVVLHTTVLSGDMRVEVCLFGSKDNVAGYVGGSDNPPNGWSSSAAIAVDNYVKSRATVNNSQWDDPEAIAVEALTIATEQGVDQGPWSEYDGKPWARGFTLGRSDESEWFAEIYDDVLLDKDRWSFGEGGISNDVDRILIGAPLWVRTPRPDAAMRYKLVRNGRLAPPL